MVYHGDMSTTTSAATIDDDATLNRVFGALSDPTRRSIVTQLAQGDATMTEIASRFEMSLPGVSKHVSVLENAGLVHRWRSGRSRRCRLQVDRMETANEWLGSQTAFWTDTLSDLARFIEDGNESA
jgi:DNA-binding transcriptional ArsR family regulator